MPLIGLVCEGPTDRIAIEWYVRKSLVERGFSDITFRKIPEHTDQTSKDIQGCTMVLAWLSKEPGERQKLLGDIFANGLRRCDAIVAHLDADNLSMSQFRQHTVGAILPPYSYQGQTARASVLPLQEVRLGPCSCIGQPMIYIYNAQRRS